EGFDVEEVLTNSIWYEAQASLAELARELGDAETAQAERSGADLTQDAILRKCWDADARAFFSPAGNEEGRLRVLTAASLLPCLLDNLSEEQRKAIVEDVEAGDRFATRFPLPSVAVCEPSFESSPRYLLWRGP